MSAASRVDTVKTQQTSSSYVYQAFEIVAAPFKAAGRHFYISETTPSLTNRVCYYSKQVLETSANVAYKTAKVTGVVIVVCCLVVLPMAGAFIVPQGGANRVYECHNDICNVKTPEAFIRDGMARANLDFGPESVEGMAKLFQMQLSKESAIVTKLLNEVNALENFGTYPKLPSEAVTLDENNYPTINFKSVTSPLMTGEDSFGRKVMTVRYQQEDAQGNRIGKIQNALLVEDGAAEEWTFMGTPGQRPREPMFETGPTYYRLV